ncbi:Aste57867_14354 [Aphanomyces stellatus]|uniref:Aste57867_14354 protein n=1 Tax=Aphanomyces stellatus TaxID=120398 RepID=A0A485L1A4_9STRA|nr:hypothetical protein As57867_014300 [Aphanomyces stellatus]VFT91178.1 Aste57867_14354 [Aphanomyces stellatus]
MPFPLAVLFSVVHVLARPAICASVLDHCSMHAIASIVRAIAVNPSFPRCVGATATMNVTAAFLGHVLPTPTQFDQFRTTLACQVVFENFTRHVDVACGQTGNAAPPPFERVAGVMHGRWTDMEATTARPQPTAAAPCRFMISVEGDATFCVDVDDGRSVCAGLGHACPRKGAVATEASCAPHLPSFDQGVCRAREDAECRRVGSGVWGCAWPDGNKSTTHASVASSEIVHGKTETLRFNGQVAAVAVSIGTLLSLGLLLGIAYSCVHSGGNFAIDSSRRRTVDASQRPSQSGGPVPLSHRIDNDEHVGSGCSFLHACLA